MKNKTIVIGTFDYDVYEHLSARLSGLNYHVRFVQRGVKILSEILENDVDLLILDLDLAGVLGLEILPVIRRLRPRLPIILITDDLNDNKHRLAAEMGITYQTYKPVSTAETLAIATATVRLLERQTFEFAAL